MSKKSMAITALVVGVLGVLVAFYFGVIAHEDAEDASTAGQRISGSGNVQGGNDVAGQDVLKGNSCVAQGSSQVICNLAPPQTVSPNEGDDDAAKRIKRDVAPTGEGPWAFSVLFDDREGLFVRTSPEKDGQRIGYLPHAGIMYVDCWKTSGFDPVPGLNYGPRWYLVHWPSVEPSEGPLRSSPAFPAQGWAWGYYLQPNGHNGTIPQCKA